MVIHSASSVGEWETLASATFVPVHVESPLESFSGTMHHLGDHEWGVTSIRSGAGRVSRTAELLTSSADDVALFSVQVRGVSGVEQDGRQARVHAGDGVLYLSRREYQLTFPHPAEVAVVQVPRESLGMRAGALEAITARPLHVRQDLALRTFSRLVRSLFTQRPVIAEPREALRVSTEILSSVLGQRRRAPARARSHSALFAAFDRAVHDHLDDPALDVAALGAIENVSMRTVHLVFAERGTTPAAHIRAARMRLAQRLLSTTNLPLADIALRCGGADPSVFSRAFRHGTGITPSEYRRHAASSSPRAQLPTHLIDHLEHVDGVRE